MQSIRYIDILVCRSNASIAVLSKWSSSYCFLDFRKLSVSQIEQLLLLYQVGGLKIIPGPQQLAEKGHDFYARQLYRQVLMSAY